MSNHFSTVAADYARYRPRYPASLFVFLASVCERRDQAWDCATGNGQAAVGLAEHFAHVIATDASAAQIAHAEAHPRVTYRVAPAEASGLEEASCDLACVAQAMHWLNPTAFMAEAARVARRGAVVAIWGYERMAAATPAIQDVFDRFNADVLGPFWSPHRAMIEDGYRSLAFPFEELPPEPFVLHASFTAETLARHVGTWSATNRFREEHRADPVPSFLEDLRRVWPSREHVEAVTWPGVMRIGRKT